MDVIKSDSNIKQTKPLLAFVNSLPFIKVYKETNAITRQAMEDAENKKVIKHKNTKKLISFLNK